MLARITAFGFIVSAYVGIIKCDFAGDDILFPEIAAFIERRREVIYKDSGSIIHAIFARRYVDISN
jgi:hypothetical protein